MKKDYHLILMNLEKFPNDDIELRRIKNFVESAYAAGVYVISFGYHEILESANESVQAILKHFKHVKVRENKFDINEKIFEFTELLDNHDFEPLNIEKELLLQKAMDNADLEEFINPENIKLETNTKVK